MTKFIDAYNSNGKKQVIPAAWLDHPVLGKGFTKTPPRKADRENTTTTKTPASGADNKE